MQQQHSMTTKDSIMLLCTRFDSLGDWTVEQQFVLQMGSSYLLAHGIGTPLKEDAKTSVNIPKDGEYTLWVRTKNWTAFWSEGKTPGIFQVKINGKPDEAEFGIGKGGNTPKTSWMAEEAPGRSHFMIHRIDGSLCHSLTTTDGTRDSLKIIKRCGKTTGIGRRSLMISMSSGMAVFLAPSCALGGEMP